MFFRIPLFTLLLTLAVVALAASRSDSADTTRGDQLLRDYFRAETGRLSGQCLTHLKTLSDWTDHRETYLHQLREMVGLDPLPERTPLNAVVTGRTDHPEMTVERIRFESRPRLYVTANLYLPKGLTKPAPAILYVCGHGNVKKDGVSYGAKTWYQHHGAWFARNGYVCLTIDTLQLGEIEGLHHGTFREGMWWWNSRGYTPAGVEAWNGIRALDYLQSRPEVDGARLGVTGRSGGGAYTWYIAALDDRVKVAVPTAGITDLENHVVDNCIEGHCDCMFMVNTYRWDYPQLAAMVAPRPLLIENSDKDPIFPLDGVVRVHKKVRELYRLYGAPDKLALTITDGPHKDTQELQVPMLHWFNRYLKGEDPPLETVARPLFQPEQLRVLESIPADQRNTTIHETFVPTAAAPEIPKDEKAWERQRDAWMKALREKCFAGWPAEETPLDVKVTHREKNGNDEFTTYEFTSQEHVPLRLYVVAPTHPKPLSLNIIDDAGRPGDLTKILPKAFQADFGGPTADGELWHRLRGRGRLSNGIVWFAPRGLGVTAWSGTPQQKVHIRRRFMLLGQTLDGMRVWDIRRAMQALRSIKQLRGAPLYVNAGGEMAGNSLYASLFEAPVAGMQLSVPRADKSWPDYLNVMRVLNTPQAIALAADRAKVQIWPDRETVLDWDYLKQVGAKLHWPADQFLYAPVSGSPTRF